MLPVLLESAALRIADPYLTALTLLEPAGNVAAETAAFIATLDPPPPVGDVLLDEAHGQVTWRYMPPTAALGYREAIRLLAEDLDLSVGVIEERAMLSARVLADFAVLILPIAPERGTVLTHDELAAVASFVAAGRGLLVMGTYTGDWHHEANLNQVLKPFGIRLQNDSIVPSGTSATGHLFQSEPTSGHAFAVARSESRIPPELAHDLLHGVSSVSSMSACSILLMSDAATGLLTADGVDIYEPKPSGQGVAIDGYTLTDRSRPTVAAASTVAKVFVTGSWKMFLNPFLRHQSHSNRQLLENVISWLAGTTTSRRT